MTMNLEKIYDQYRKADLTDRLNIYLQFPELRNDFLEIEQKAAPPISFGTAKSQSKKSNGVGRWISRRFSFL